MKNEVTTSDAPEKRESAEQESLPESKSSPESKEAKRLLELLDGFKIAMLVERHGKRMAARPMTIVEREPSGKLWFLTTLDADQTRTLEFSSRVQVVCQSVMVYLSISGEAKIVRDQAKLDALWKDEYRVWFAEGRQSKDLAAISVDLQEGEFWDQSGFKGLKFIFEAAKAYLAGEELETDEQMHAKAVLRQN